MGAIAAASDAAPSRCVRHAGLRTRFAALLRAVESAARSAECPLRFLRATLVAASLTASRVRCVYRAVVWIRACPRSLAITGRLSPSASARARERSGAGRAGARRRGRHGRAPCARARRGWRAGLPRLRAGDHPGVVGQALDRGQHLPPPRARARPCAGRSCCRCSLELLRLQAHVLPAQRQDLVAPAAGQHQQPQRRSGMGRDTPGRLELIQGLA